MSYAPNLVHIIDEDPDLAVGLFGARRAAARQRALAPVVHFAHGRADFIGEYGSAGGWFGLLVLDGLILQSASVLERTTAQVLAPGDVFCPWEVEQDSALLPASVSYEVVAESRVALLDEAFAERVRPWSEIASALIARADRRAHGLTITGALAAYPRVDVRIVSLLWQLAERSGVAVDDGTVVLPVRLTHETIARIVGCERSSVSSALGSLRREGLIVRDEGGWLLNGSLPLQIEYLLTRQSRRSLAIVSGEGPRGRVGGFRTTSTG
jgi:CRP/FNR family transcriptional regulator, cyclic AMP receptor protein